MPRAGDFFRRLRRSTGTGLGDVLDDSAGFFFALDAALRLVLACFFGMGAAIVGDARRRLGERALAPFLLCFSAGGCCGAGDGVAGMPTAASRLATARPGQRQLLLAFPRVLPAGYGFSVL